MVYMGSKNRIAKYILPIMLEDANKKGITTWVEPFVGGGNIIDKVPDDFQRIGIDLNAHVIAALIAIRDLVDELPENLTKEEYKLLKGSEPEPIKSWLRFVCSFAGKFEEGYARDKTGRNYAKEGASNAKKQSPKLQGVKLINGSYDQHSYFKNCLIYCDPPYENTASYKTGVFDHIKFWDWCRKMSKNNLVYVSEYKAPNDFICIWEGKSKTNLNPQRKTATEVTEKLFKYNK